MKRNNLHHLINRIRVTLFGLCLAISTAQAAMPLWTFEPLTPTTVVVPANGTAMVQYQVTNQSSRPHALRMQSIQGITQITTEQGFCSSLFVLQSKNSCILSLQINGSQLNSPITDGPVVCQQGNLNQCYRPSAANVLNITQAPPIFVLTTLTSINPNQGTTSGGVGVTLTGTGFTGATAVTFGGIPATFVNVVSSTTVTAVTPAHAAGIVDVVIDTPVGVATLANGFTYVATAVGQPSNGGIIACLNGGLNNLIAATADNSTGIPWGGMTLTGAQSTIDGSSNTIIIVNCLTGPGGGAGCPMNIPINTYAAGLCASFEVDSQGNTPCQAGNACYDDWFLPADHNTTTTGQLNCLFTNKTAIGGFNIAANYWSSTESTATTAYAQNFGTGVESVFTKTTPGGFVRCVRAFTS